MCDRTFNRLVGVVIENIALGAVGLGFDSRAGQIAYRLLPLRRFFGAVLPKRYAA